MGAFQCSLEPFHFRDYLPDRLRFNKKEPALSNPKRAGSFLREGGLNK